MDADQGNNGVVSYRLADNTDRNLPFMVLPKDGSIYNTKTFNLSSTTYKFNIVAENNNVSSASDRLSSTAEVIVSSCLSLLQYTYSKYFLMRTC